MYADSSEGRWELTSVREELARQIRELREDVRRITSDKAEIERELRSLKASKHEADRELSDLRTQVALNSDASTYFLMVLSFIVAAVLIATWR